MPRSSCTGALVFDLEIERTIKANRKTKRQEDNSLSSLNINVYSKNKKPRSDSAKNWGHGRTKDIRELATPNMN